MAHNVTEREALAPKTSTNPLLNFYAECLRCQNINYLLNKSFAMHKMSGAEQKRSLFNFDSKEMAGISVVNSIFTFCSS